MRFTSVLARFLPLMDISILLLGLFIVLTAAGQMNHHHSQNSESAVNIPKEARPLLEGAARLFVENNLAPIWLYACCDGEYRNCCQLMDDDFIPGRIIDIRSDSDIARLIESKQPRHAVIFMMIPEGGFDSFWDQERTAIEAAWHTSVVWVSGVKFPGHSPSL